MVALGDIHTYRLTVPPWLLLSKRLFGQMNLWLSRRHRFDLSILPLVAKRITEVNPELLLATGDFSSTARPEELEDAARPLRTLMRQVPTIAIPGNHDRYTPWTAWKSTFERSFGPFMPTRFPHFRLLNDRWALLVLDSAVPRAFYSSRGKLGRSQIEQVRAYLSTLTDQQGVVVLCHYPIATPPGVPMLWSHRMADADVLTAVLAEFFARRSLTAGRLIYIHGHTHRCALHEYRTGKLAGMVDLDAGAACLANRMYGLGQGFWQLFLPDDPADRILARHHRPIGRKDPQWITSDQVVPPRGNPPTDNR